jgi:DNA mismatch repair ATPase MutS
VVEVVDADARALLAYRALIDPLRAAGLPFCRPTYAPAGALAVRGTFDLALADRLVGAGAPVVRNDVVLEPGERVIVVTGPNQGGKTTLARTVGQLHLLAALGLKVPGTSARIAVPDRVVTLFERQEQVVDRVSMLERDLLRAAALIDRSTDRTVAVVNELFSSTATKDATVLGERLLRRLLARRTLTVYVTFLDELTTLDPAVASMVSTVDPADPATRTFRVVRRPADGRAYAIALATRYGLTRDQVRERVGREG